MGATLVEQALIDPAMRGTDLAVPPTDDSFAAAAAKLLKWYDALRPHLLRDGLFFPENDSIQQRMPNDAEIDVATSFDPAAAAAANADGQLPDSVRVHVSAAGSIGNGSFVAIPFSAAHQAGAKVVADALLDLAVQARMQDITVLRSLLFLHPSRLDGAGQTAFAALHTAPALPLLADLGTVPPEPHPDWMARLTTAWPAH